MAIYLPTRTIARDAAWLRAALERVRSIFRPKDKELAKHLRLDIDPAEEAMCAHAFEVAQALGLTQVEFDLWLVAVGASIQTPAAGMLEVLEAPSRHVLVQGFGKALRLPRDELRRAMRPGGALVKCLGLRTVAAERMRRLHLNTWEGTVRALQLAAMEGESALQLMFRRVPASTLGPADYAHLDPMVDVLVRLLEAARKERPKGVHILLEGPPGTGKSQLARVLVQAVEAEGYQVSSQDSDGDVVRGAHRMMDWQKGQRLFARNDKAVLVFDEAEDAFLSLGEGASSDERDSKAGFNESLEGAVVPTIWIANDLSEVDPAYLRRFLVHLRVPVPPMDVRQRLVRDALGPLGVDEQTQARLVSDNSLTPAQVDRVARVLTLVRPTAGGEASRLSAALVRGARPKPADEVPARFDPRVFESDADADKLAERLASLRSGRVLLHGPPGTGKSAFARFVAERCGVPLVLTRPSDILGPYVGQTEQGLAQRFAQAKACGGLLVFDEIEGLFMTRDAEGAAHRMSQIGQALMELERFEGMFIGTTNLLTAIDRAFLRRFDVVLEVGPPKEARRRHMLTTLCTELGFETPSASLVASLQGLTPGHVAQARRRWRLVGAPSSAQAMGEALRQLVSPTARAPVGFA